MRLYEPQPLQVNQTIILSERTTHHLINVLRAKNKDEIILFNGKGGEFQGTITNINKKSVTVLLNSFSNREVESPIKIHLIQALPKADKMDFIVQKAVELGVSSITPIIAERSQGRLAPAQQLKKHERLTAIIIAASEQCGRNTIPILNEIILFNEWIKLHEKKACYILTPHTEEHSELKIAANEVYLIIGPEGGFTPNEIKLALAKKIMPLTLGKRILRTETASLAALAILQWQFGDLQLR